MQNGWEQWQAAWRSVVIVIGLCGSLLAQAQPDSVNADANDYETKVLAKAEALQSRGKKSEALALLKQADASCANCPFVKRALATANCEMAAADAAAGLLSQPVSQACAGVASPTARQVSIPPDTPQRESAGSTSSKPPTKTPLANAGAVQILSGEVVSSNVRRQLNPPNADAPNSPDVAAAITAAQQLIARGKNEAAYQLLLPFEAQALGYATFDYTIGIAALDSGRPGDAIFALQRVVAEQPDFLGAQLEFGRALYERGDYRHAKLMFEELETRQPPASAAKVIDSYLLAIKRQTRHQRRSVTAYVEAGIGGDSNATAGTDASTIGPFTLDPNARRKGSARAELGVGMHATLPMSARWQVVAAADGRITEFPAAEFVSGNAVSASVGLGYRRQQWRVTGLVSGRHQTFDGNFNHSSRQGSLNVERLLGDHWRLRLGYQAGRVEFSTELGLLDIDQQLLSPGFAVSWNGAARPAAVFTTLFGRDDARQPGSPYGRNIAGVRGQYSRDLGAGRLFLTGSLLNSNYRGLFGGATNPERRQDAQQFMSLAWVLQNWPAERWQLTPEILLLNNDSSVELFDYERVWAMLTLRREFE